jgi:hypothetical protein
MNRRFKPAIFRLDDPGVVVTQSEQPRAAAPTDDSVPASEAQMIPAPKRRHRIPWTGLFWSSAAGLTLLATGLGIANLIADLLNRSACRRYDGARGHRDAGSGGPRGARRDRRTEGTRRRGPSER